MVIPGCKNGVVDKGEGCDSRSLGCKSDCTVDPLWECFTENKMSRCSNRCGNGLRDTNEEECDNKNILGCKNCKIEPSYTCFAPLN